ncbi:MAG: hypothetical protein RLZZ605_97 [Bacteroidota bacterium]|jgi:hypothetical protein
MQGYEIIFLIIIKSNQVRKLTKVTDATKFRILVDLCESKGIHVCTTYKESFTESYPIEDTRWWVFQLSKEGFTGEYEVLGTNGYEDELISYEQMIDEILGINKTITLSLSNLLTAYYEKGDSYMKIGNDAVDIIKLEELLTRVNQLNA